MRLSLLSRIDARDRELFARWAAATDASLVWKVLTHLGGVWCSVVAAVAPIIRGGTLGAASRHALATLVVSHVVVQVIKRTVGRPRPSSGVGCATLVVEPDRFSFPSGHAAAAMSVTFAYALAYPSLGVVLMPLAVLVGLSRVCLAVHYPGDVIMGQLIALATGVLLRT
jgi:undecaprenyl-diphosphatase